MNGVVIRLAVVVEVETEIEQAVAMWERARTMGPLIRTGHYYESAGRHEDAQAIVQEMLSDGPEMTAQLRVEILARFWNEKWIPEDLEGQLRIFLEAPASR